MNKNLPTQFFQPAIMPPEIQDMRQELSHAANKEDAQKAATAIVKEYISYFGVNGVRNDMWVLLSGTLGQADVNYMAKAVERYNLFFFYEFTLLFMDAVNVLHG